ncbi:MAG: family 43 glycosylhydrolase [Bacteroidaceae bacterium]|nr:family 43 glycosylhydrolase [Bacteroidaceae bacterium]
MKKNSIAITMLALSACVAVEAQNPIVPTGSYMADPSAHQWKDGKVYVYGSRDESKQYYCSSHYDVLVSEDMINWKMERDVFSSVSPKDEVSYSDRKLYAPDCIEKDGKYYLFYCLDGGGEDEGTAVADSPVGPYKDGQIVKGARQIDPSVFIDDDGPAYMTWGQFECKMAKLKPNMREIDPETIRTDVLTEEEHYFHEGSQLIKRNGLYYLIFADISRRGRPTSIGYATATSPFGPYTYRGVIVDNYGSDPRVWNNHGSLAEVNGQWFVFYHRPTDESVMMRKACVEPITFNADGSINEVEMTTQGAAGPLNPFKEMEAERACYLTGHVRVHRDADGNEMLDEIRNEDTAAFKYFQFDRTPTSMTISVRSTQGGTIHVYANNLSRPRLCTFQVPVSDGKEVIRLTQKITHKLDGKHPIFFRFNGEGDTDLFAIESFQFE